MTGEELTKQWNKMFPDFPPVAAELKHFFKERWFRIHTLPESKRYAENKSEYNEILNRHNVILSDLFSADHSYILLSEYGSESKEPVTDKRIEKLNLQKNYRLSLQADDDDSEHFYSHFYFDSKCWEENSLNDLFLLIADDEIRNIMLFSIEKSIVYHPYDGGADIFFKNSELRDIYKEKYINWLSKHPLGL
jgi:hypothetical protein